MNAELLIEERNILMESFLVTDLISCLHTIDINSTELCNRTCEFCPRHGNVYENQNLHMSLETASKLGKHLSDIKYKNQIQFGGQCEPLLTRNFNEIVRTLKDYIPYNQNFHLTTNGDRLTDKSVSELIEAGINHINVSCYDGPEQYEKFNKMLQGKLSFTLKKFWFSASVNWGLPAISNRAGKLFEIKKAVDKKCNLPFYSCNIDWNGNVYLCVHDWNKQQIFGNVHYSSLKDIWVNDKFTEYRKMLISESRSCKPCNGCDVSGDYYGNRNFELFKSML